MTDKQYIEIAIKESKKRDGAYRFGAVVVVDDEIIAQDCNHTVEHNDPSAHAEVSALRKACEKMGSQNIEGATLYASHEPCMMCLCCAAWANVERIVYAHKADELTEDMYEFKNAEFADIASKLQRPVKTEYLAL